MEFTRKQTSVIVLEIVVIFVGIVSILRLTQPQNQIGFSAGGMVSITTASAVYVPPTTEILRKMDTKTSTAKTITIQLGERQKKPAKTIELEEKKLDTYKRSHKRKKKASAVINIDLDNHE